MSDGSLNAEMAVALRALAARSLNPEPLLIAANQIEEDGRTIMSLRAAITTRKAEMIEWRDAARRCRQGGA